MRRERCYILLRGEREYFESVEILECLVGCWHYMAFGSTHQCIIVEYRWQKFPVSLSSLYVAQYDPGVLEPTLMPFVILLQKIG